MAKRPFAGTSYVDIQIQALGVTIKRLVAVTYSYRPAWPYYDTELKREITAQAALKLSLAVLARRLGRSGLDGVPDQEQVWVSIDGLLVPGLLKPKVYDRLLQYIDHSARARDRMARQKAGQPAPPTPETL
jgi:hypothetical protein